MNFSPWLVLQGQLPVEINLQRFTNHSLNEISNYGPTLDDLINLFSHLTATRERMSSPTSSSSSSSSPPASWGLIESMSSVEITEDLSQLVGTQCPVCLEEFEIGTKTREMSCGHHYHSHCIVPWLVKCNSCPVCRHGLSPESTPERNDERNAGRGRRWKAFSFLLPSCR